MRQVWINPANPSQQVRRDSRSLAPPPAGYVLGESGDGALTRDQQSYVGNQTSGGYPAYSNAPGWVSGSGIAAKYVGPANPNGITGA